MEVTLIRNAAPYSAPRHFDMCAHRLQGLEASGADFAWVGYSQFQPGGRAEMEAGALPKIYVVISGQVTIELGDGTTTVLSHLDSCHIPAGEARAVYNRTNEVATMLVIMPYPEAQQ